MSHGISFPSGGANIQIQNNQIDGRNGARPQVSVCAGNGIYITSAPDQVLVSGNEASWCRIGIEIDNATNSIVQNNIATNNGGSSYAHGQITVSGTNISITGNRGGTSSGSPSGDAYGFRGHGTNMLISGNNFAGNVTGAIDIDSPSTGLVLANNFRRS